MDIDFDTLFRLHRRELVWRLTRILSCGETAQELVQESYLVLAKEAAKQPVQHPRGFLYRVAIHLAFDHLRRKKLEDQHQKTLILDEEPQSLSSERIIDSQEKVAIFRQALEDLPPRCREAFILHKLQGLSYRDVAERLGISQSAVEKHIMKALLRCRSTLEAHGYDAAE